MTVSLGFVTLVLMLAFSRFSQFVMLWYWWHLAARFFTYLATRYLPPGSTMQCSAPLTMAMSTPSSIASTTAASATAPNGGATVAENWPSSATRRKQRREGRLLPLPLRLECHSCQVIVVAVVVDIMQTMMASMKVPVTIEAIKMDLQSMSAMAQAEWLTKSCRSHAKARPAS